VNGRLRISDWPLRAKMAALLLASSLLPLVLATWISIYETRQRMLADTEALLASNGERLADHLDAYQKGYLRSVNQLSNLSVVSRYCEAKDVAERAKHSQDVSRIMEVWLASDANIRGVAMLNLAGKVVLATENKLVGADLSRHGFVKAAQGGTAVISEVHLAEPALDGVPVIAYLAPVKGGGGQPAGLAAFWIRAGFLGEMMNASNELAGTDSHAMLFDLQGIAIAHSRSPEITYHPGGKLAPATVNALVAERRFGEKTREWLEDVRSFPEPFEIARSGKVKREMFQTITPGNQKSTYVVARRCSTAPWTVFSMIPQKSLDREIMRMVRDKTLFAGGVFLASIIVGSLYAASIVKPVHSLAAATRTLASGDLTARAEVRGTDELGQLGVAFNSMAGQLEAHSADLSRTRGELEMRVRERTAELEKATGLYKSSEERTRRIIECALDAVISMDNTGHITGWNPQAEIIFGWSSEKALGRMLLETIIPERSREAHMQGVAHYLAAGQGAVINRRVELTALHRDGHEFPIELGITPIWTGKSVSFSAFVRDITERRQAEAALKASESRYKMLFEYAPDGIVIADPENNYLDANASICRMLGYTRDEMIHMKASDIVMPGVILQVPVADESIERDQSQYHWRWKFRRKNGTTFTAEVIASMIPDGNMLGMIRDITERQRAEEAIQELNAQLEERVIERTAKLEAANHELEAFSYSVSHDLRAPLRAVDGFSQAMLEDYAALLPEEGRRYLETIRHGAQKMGALIDDLLTFSRLSRQPLQFQEINTVSLVRGVLEDLRLDEIDRQLDVRLGVLPPCQGDPALLRQVWINLLSNAVKYTRKRDHAVVEIGCEATPEGNVYFVRDNGTGFDMRYYDKLFGVFQRLHRAEDYEGTGVGLAIVQRIIHRHGGRVWAEAAVDQGACFYFTLEKPAETINASTSHE
jgi:PAS domain S-box-containing protein